MELNSLARFVVALVLVAAMAISGRFRKQARDSGQSIRRRDEGMPMLAARLLLALPLLVLLVLNIAWPGSVSWSKIALQPTTRALGLMTAVAVVPLIYWVFQHIGKNISETVLTSDQQELVTSGPYAYIRHPLYSFALLLITAMGTALADWVIMLYGVLGLMVFRLAVIPAEEKHLIKAFGEQYEHYRQHTGALLPRLRGRG